MLTFSGISRQFEGFGRDVICWREGLSSTEAYVTLETMTVTFTLRHCGCQLSECPLAHRGNKYSRKKTRNTVWTRFASKSRYWARKQRSSAYREWRAVELLLREIFSLYVPGCWSEDSEIWSQMWRHEKVNRDILFLLSNFFISRCVSSCLKAK